MNYQKEQKRFEELCNSLGNRYLAVNFIANNARYLANNTNNVILHSEAVSWSILGDKPKILNKYKSIFNNRDYLESLISTTTQYIDNNYIKQSVRQSIYTSNQRHHLVYAYHNKLDDNDRIRVRILTKIIWYKLHPFRYKSSILR